MKYKYVDVVRDVLGNVISNPEISFYLSGTTTPAKVYDSSGTAISITPQITGDEFGRVEFSADDADFAVGKTFDISIHKDGYNDLVKSNMRIIDYNPNAVNISGGFITGIAYLVNQEFILQDDLTISNSKNLVLEEALNLNGFDITFRSNAKMRFDWRS